MPTTNDERYCATLAIQFQQDMAKQLKYVPSLQQTDITAGGVFLGEISADKYRECMKAKTKPANQPGF